MTAHNNKRIAKNTLLLYSRSFITVLISLYTSRVVLEALGETNFGIYNVVGSIVVLFAFIQNAMTSATQRFLNYEMGCGNSKSINRVFSMSITAHFSIVILVLILAETVGLWYVSTQLNIPAERHSAAMWVYQFSVLATCINIIKIPYHAIIIAYEKMNFYAYMSIVESALKLLIVYLLTVTFADRLISYSILVCAVIFVSAICYKIYCNRYFPTSRYRFFWDSKLYKNLMSFSGWSLFGSVASVGANQGINLLLNVFYGVTVNAAMGIANQVTMAVSSFAANFTTAFKPQLVKSYAVGEHDYFIKLICQTSKYSFILIYLMALPLIICTEPILNIWLTEVPEYAISFTQLMLIFTIIETTTTPFWLSIQAIGKIKRYQILMSFLILLNLPIAYYLLWSGYSPVWVFTVKVVLNLIIHVVRVLFLSKLIVFPIAHYFTAVMGRIILIILFTAPLTLLAYRNTDGIGGVMVTILTSILLTTTFSYLVGLSRNEKRVVNGYIKRLILIKKT